MEMDNNEYDIFMQEIEEQNRSMYEEQMKMIQDYDESLHGDE